MNFFAFGYEPAKIPFRAETGTLLLNESPRVTSRPEEMQAYLPHDPEMAKMGVYLHALTDRGSHRICTDRSYFYQDAAGNFTSVYSSVRPSASKRAFVRRICLDAESTMPACVVFNKLLSAV